MGRLTWEKEENIGRGQTAKDLWCLLSVWALSDRWLENEEIQAAGMVWF